MLRKYAHFPWWLIATLTASFVVRIPSFFEPYYYGDEMIYLTLGNGIRRGLTLYKDIHDNKPPLLYFLASISGNVFWFRALLCLSMIVTIIAFWYLVRELFTNKKTVVASTIIFAFLTSLPFFEGEVANAELFMLLPTILACLIVWKGKGYKSALLGGILLSVAALFKIPSIFDAGAVVSLWLFAIKFKKAALLELIRNVFFLILGIIIPISLTFVWYFLKGAFNEYFVAAFLQNFGYIRSWGGVATPQISFFAKNGPLIVRTGLVVVGFLVLFLFRHKRSKPFLFAAMWVITSLFAVALSERPYPHYYVQVLPALSLLLGILTTDDSLEQALVVFPLSAVFFVGVYFHFWQYSSSLYFGRFITLLTEGQDAYFDRFSPVVKRNYDLSELIDQTTSESDHIFVWGDSASIYALSKRIPPIKYVADYHIKDFSSEEETLKGLTINPPKLMLFLPESELPEGLYRFAKTNYVSIKTLHGVTIWYNTSQ